MNPTLCQIPGCAIRGRHLPACEVDDCRGCLPRLATEGLICETHERWAAQHLAEIERLTPDARLVAAGQVRRGHGGTGGKPGSRSPGNDEATDRLDEALDKIARPALRIAVRRGMRLHMPCIKSCVRPTPSQAHCSVCHETFAGPTLFDAHRRGTVEARYCLDPAEMTDRGIPLRRDAYGVWRSGAARPETGSGEPQTADSPLVGVAPRADESDGSEAFSGGDA